MDKSQNGQRAPLTTRNVVRSGFSLQAQPSSKNSLLQLLDTLHQHRRPLLEQDPQSVARLLAQELANLQLLQENHQISSSHFMDSLHELLLLIHEKQDDLALSDHGVLMQDVAMQFESFKHSRLALKIVRKGRGLRKSQEVEHSLSAWRLQQTLKDEDEQAASNHDVWASGWSNEFFKTIHRQPVPSVVHRSFSSVLKTDAPMVLTVDDAVVQVQQLVERQLLHVTKEATQTLLRHDKSLSVQTLHSLRIDSLFMKQDFDAMTQLAREWKAMRSSV